MKILTLHEINRMTLARQFLLERTALPIPAVMERLVGMQAQLASAPYVGLWTRLHNFQRDDLAALIEQHTILKATLMRATLHLFTAVDFLRLRGALQPVLDNAQQAISKSRGEALDIEALLQLALPYLAEKPRTFAEISEHFAALMPNTDIGAIRYTIRTQLPLVQVPTDTQWSYPGNPQFTLAETWLGQSIPMHSDLKTLFFRYLAGFGPATITDFQKWSGLGKMKSALEPFRAELVTYKDEQKRELFDLPEMPLPDTAAPVRFLPEFDNLLLGYDKRTRLIADAHRSRVYLPGLRVAATFLVDGFVRGRWTVEKVKGVATLQLEPFEPITEPDREALVAEGEALIRFVEPGAKSYSVQWVG